LLIWGPGDRMLPKPDGGWRCALEWEKARSWREC
jgi:hypothetical protein